MLPLSKARLYTGQEPTGEAFRPEWIDFEHGIRVGNIEPHERITQILKYYLVQRYKTPFITDRWGRGVYWQWICWLPKANKLAKTISSSTNFGCAKFFISVGRENKIFQAGLQVERGYLRRPPKAPGETLQRDWDWHRLVRECREGKILPGELERLVGENGFYIEVGDWDHNTIFDAASYGGIDMVSSALENTPPDRWVGFQLYYSMADKEVRSCSGIELVEAIQGIFAEVVPSMNACMQVQLEAKDTIPHFDR